MAGGGQFELKIEGGGGIMRGGRGVGRAGGGLTIFCSGPNFSVPLTQKLRRSTMISESITFRTTKAKAKVKFGVKHPYKH